jgi:hypothetical protein
LTIIGHATIYRYPQDHDAVASNKELKVSKACPLVPGARRVHVPRIERTKWVTKCSLAACGSATQPNLFDRATHRRERTEAYVT